MDYQLVLVEWEDPWSNGGWIDKEEALKLASTPGRGECKTVGWIIEEKKEYLLIAGSIGISKDAQVGDIFKLPRRCIDKVTQLQAVPSVPLSIKTEVTKPKPPPKGVPPVNNRKRR